MEVLVVGSAKGVRYGHGGGHLREPVLEIVEGLYARDPRWWEVTGDASARFDSPEAAYAHLGRLWHCTDIVPSRIRAVAEELLGDGTYDTYAQLVRALRPFLRSQRRAA